MKYVKSILKDDGHILIATYNKFGMRNWANIPTNENKINYNAISDEFSMEKNQCYSKNMLEKIFNKINIGERKYYYPLPDYKFTNVIFTDNFLANENLISRDIVINDVTDIMNFREEAGYEQILKENKNLFSFFSNSFFIDISSKLKENDIKYISYRKYEEIQI